MRDVLLVSGLALGSAFCSEMLVWNIILVLFYFKIH